MLGKNTVVPEWPLKLKLRDENGKDESVDIVAHRLDLLSARHLAGWERLIEWERETEKAESAKSRDVPQKNE